MASKQNIGYQELLHIYTPLHSIFLSAQLSEKGSTLHFHITIYHVGVITGHTDRYVRRSKIILRWLSHAHVGELRATY
jgi:hypothetical protein